MLWRNHISGQIRSGFSSWELQLAFLEKTILRERANNREGNWKPRGMREAHDLRSSSDVILEAGRLSRCSSSSIQKATQRGLAWCWLFVSPQQQRLAESRKVKSSRVAGSPAESRKIFAFPAIFCFCEEKRKGERKREADESPSSVFIPHPHN